MSDAQFTVYGKAGCTWCTAVVSYLEYMGPTFEYIDVSEDEEARQFLVDNSFATVPQVFEGEDHIGGYEATVDHLRNQ